MLKKIIKIKGVISFYLLIILSIVAINARLEALNNNDNETIAFNEIVIVNK